MNWRGGGRADLWPASHGRDGRQGHRQFISISLSGPDPTPLLSLLHTLHSKLSTPHSALYSVESTLYTPHSTLCTVHCPPPPPGAAPPGPGPGPQFHRIINGATTPPAPVCSLHSAHYTLYTRHFTPLHPPPSTTVHQSMGSTLRALPVPHCLLSRAMKEFPVRNLPYRA